MPFPPSIDCHAHLCDPVFDADRGAVLDRARAAGVEAIVAVAETEIAERVHENTLRLFGDFVRVRPDRG